MLINQCWSILFSFLKHALLLSGHSFSTGILDVSVQRSMFSHRGMSDMSGCSGCVSIQRRHNWGECYLHPKCRDMKPGQLMGQQTAQLWSCLNCVRCTLQLLSSTDLYSEAWFFLFPFWTWHNHLTWVEEWKGTACAMCSEGKCVSLWYLGVCGKGYIGAYVHILPVYTLDYEKLFWA